MVVGLMTNDRIGIWRGQTYQVGDEVVAPDAETGVEWRARVTGIGDDGRIYVQRLEVLGNGG